MPTSKIEQGLILIMAGLGELKQQIIDEEKSRPRLFLIHGGLSKQSLAQIDDSVDVDVGEPPYEAE
ncbi:hypothetical protein [Bdellovibrio sp. HCB288]|uniref:hypothetical protein n=1 Tax=Bdellovibrio sp. HCB288 TaxID=3394355 RepID=UPI0039B3DD90